MSDAFPEEGTQQQSEPYSFQPIAYIRSCYPERFGIPRQAGLVPSAIAQIIFPNTESHRLSLRGIEAFSHLWVLFVLHAQPYQSWKPLVSPPRLGGKRTVGVYASRSPNRPNPIGMSAVELSHVEFREQEIGVHVKGGDFLDRTPVLDLKPYLVYSDSIATAHSAWATQPDPILWVRWYPQSLDWLQQESGSEAERYQTLIEETIAQDPRPAYERGKIGKPGEAWHLTIDHFNITWTVEVVSADQIQANITEISR